MFAELQGNYGSRFLDMWKSGRVNQQGHDLGVINAMGMWAEKLGGFADRSDALSRALACLPEHPPTLPEFLKLVRQYCPQPDYAKLPAPEISEAEREARTKQVEDAAFKSKPPGLWWAKRILDGSWHPKPAYAGIARSFAESALSRKDADATH